MSDTTQDAEHVNALMELADEYARLRWSSAVSSCHYDKVGEKQADADAAEARAELDAAIRAAMAGSVVKDSLTGAHGARGLSPATKEMLTGGHMSTPGVREVKDGR